MGLNWQFVKVRRHVADRTCSRNIRSYSKQTAILGVVCVRKAGQWDRPNRPGHYCFCVRHGPLRGDPEMAKTGDSNTVAGIYRCDSCGERITMPLGHEFPPCPKEGTRVMYSLVTATK